MSRRGSLALVSFVASLALAPACAPGDGLSSDEQNDSEGDDVSVGMPWGASFQSDGSLKVRIRSSHATRIEVLLFTESFGADAALSKQLTKETSGDGWTT